ncbi:1456_t:CDS:1, partial [Paraglomus occultum]
DVERDGLDVSVNELLRECARVIFDGGIFDVGAGHVVVGGSGSGGGAEQKDDETDELWLITLFAYCR